MTAEALPAQRQPGTGPEPADDAAGRYVSYQLGGSEYRQYRDVLCAVNRDREPYPILPGRLEVDEVAELRDIGPDLAPESAVLDSLASVTYTPPSGRTRSTRASVVDMDAREPEWHHRLGIAARTSKKKVDTIANAVRAMGQKVEAERGWPQAYAATGLVLRDGNTAFLRPGRAALTATGADASSRCELPAGVGDQAGIQALGLDDPSTPEQASSDLFALLRVLDTVPDQPAVPLALLCQLAWAPWSGLPDLGRIAVALAGATGGLKTALAGAVTLAAQSASYQGGAGVEVPVQVKMRGQQSTTFGIDQLLHPMSGHVAIVDDYFAGRMSQREVDEAWKRLSLIADNSVTGGGGTKGGYRNGRGVINKGKFPRSCILATAEDLPDESERGSEIARYVALRLEADVDTEVLSEVQADPRALSRAHAAMVQHGLADLDAPRRALAWATDQVQRWEFAGHNRVRQSYAKLLAGAWLVGGELDQAGIDPAGFLSDAVATLRGAADEQAKRNGMRSGQQLARDPVRLWVKHFSQMLAAEPYWLADSERGGGQWREDASAHPEFAPPAIPGHGPSAVGWRQVGQSGGWTPAGRGDPLGAVYLAAGVGRTPWRPVILRMPASRWDQVCEDVARRVRSLDGWSMPAPDVLRTKLVQAGYLKADRGESIPVWSGDEKKRSCLSLDLGRILDGDNPDGEGDGADPGDGQSGTGPVSQDGPAPQPPPTDGADDGCSDYGDTAVLHDAEADTERALALVRDELGALVVDTEDRESACSGYGDTAVLQKVGSSGKPVPTASSGHGDTAVLHASSRAAERGYGVVGVLDRAGLHVAGTNDVTAVDELPGSLAEMFELAATRGVGQLWLHPELTAALPDRPADVAINAGVAHPWADLADSGLDSDPGGLAPWMAVWRAGDRRGTSRSIVLPGYEPRAPWADAPNGASLLAAVTTLNAAIGADYYHSPNVTAGQYARRHSRSIGPCEAIRAGAVPPAVRHRQMVPAKTSRALASEEDGATFCHRFDRAAAELAGMNTPLGVGEPEHRAAGPVAFDDDADRKLAGYWRLAEVPTGIDPQLPALSFSADECGEVWVTTPDVVLLRWLGVCPAIAEAWVWPDSRRALYSTSRKLQSARTALLAGRDTPAGEIAYKTHSELYKRLIGDLARTDGPHGDDRDGLWRPDWRDAIKAQTYCNIYREIVTIAREAGRFPIATHADAAYYVSDEFVPERAVPSGMTLGTGGGQWKPEGHVPLAAVQRQCGERRFHAAFEAEWSRAQGGE